MSDNFSDIWEKRDSTTPEDQKALYLEIQQIFNSSTLKIGLNINDQDDFIQDFYINKILYALSTGLALSKSNYDNLSEKGLISMMRQYSKSCYRKEKNTILAKNNNTNNYVDDLSLDNSSINLKEPFSLNAMTRPEEQLFFKDMTHKAVQFIQSSEQWVQSLILKSAKGEKLSGNDYPRRAKLGLGLRKTFYTGAESIDDYHENTMIGRWIIMTFCDDVLPLSQLFVTEIIKSLYQAALYINKNNK